MKKVGITLDGKKYFLVLDLRSALEFEKLHKKPLFAGINDMAEKQDILAIVHLLCATCRDSKNKTISKDVVLGLDMMENLPNIMIALSELLTKDKEEIKG